MMRLAFGGKCGSPGRPPDVAASRSRLSSEVSAAVPTPVAARPKKCRRVIAFIAGSPLHPCSITGLPLQHRKPGPRYRGPDRAATHLGSDTSPPPADAHDTAAES